MCVDGLGYVYESYVVLDQCDDPPSLFVFSVSVYGGVVSIFSVLAMSLGEFCFLYCDVWLGSVYDFFLVPRFC